TKDLPKPRNRNHHCSFRLRYWIG
ncbi:toprim domain protein, partial [Chlamydia psittaci 84-8471/1]